MTLDDLAVLVYYVVREHRKESDVPYHFKVKLYQPPQTPDDVEPPEKYVRTAVWVCSSQSVVTVDHLCVDLEGAERAAKDLRGYIQLHLIHCLEQIRMLRESTGLPWPVVDREALTAVENH